MIKLDNLSKVFETAEGIVTAADDINLEVAPGEICVLLGPSGCGKTTTLKMINRIIPATSGRIFIDGQDTAELDTTTLRRNIGYVIQQIGLFPNMTIAENISVVPRLLGWDKQKYLARAEQLLGYGGAGPQSVYEALSARALRWPTTAGRGDPGTGRRSTGNADGRAVWRH